MHIGIDFDNTIVSYDTLFHRCALEQELIPPDVPATKAAVRAYLWSLPDGNTPWTELQGIVYGTRMADAEMCPGVDDFLLFCRDRRVAVSIVSHKSVYPALGPRVNLREAALRWLEDRDFFSAQEFGITRDRVFFEASRDRKAERIAAAGCTHFIDDLLEVLTDPAFPHGVQRILYAPGAGSVPSSRDIITARSWPEIRRWLEAETGTR